MSHFESFQVSRDLDESFESFQVSRDLDESF